MMQESTLTRVVVVGTSCSGKTTFARRLAELTGVPHVELDALHWGPDWSLRENFRDAVLAESERTSWVMDGNYPAVRDLIWRRCTAIVWLDYPFTLVFGRALRRIARRVFLREVLYSDNRETLARGLFDSEGVLWWIVRTYWKKRREIPMQAARPEYKHAEFLVLRTPAEADAFLKELERRQERGGELG